MVPSVELSGTTGVLLAFFVIAAVVAVTFTASVAAGAILVVVAALALLILYGVGSRIDRWLRGAA